MKQHERPKVISSAKRKVCKMVCDAGSQTAVAKELGINSSHISQLLRHERLTPKLMEVLQLEGMLEVPSARYRVAADFANQKDISDFRAVLAHHNTTLTRWMGEVLECSRVEETRPPTNDELAEMMYYYGIKSYHAERESIVYHMLKHDETAVVFMKYLSRGAVADAVTIARRLMDYNEVMTAGYRAWKEVVGLDRGEGV